ncbi:MAG: YSC84-related protein [Pikeienuella sp.]
MPVPSSATHNASRQILIALGLITVLLAASLVSKAPAAERETIDARVSLALAELRAAVPGVADLIDRSRGVLMMPRVVKGGFILGAAYGEGSLLLPTGTERLQPVAYYSVASASVGLQAGLQESSHALVFLTPEALAAFRASDGWEAGVDAEVTILDGGAAVGSSTTEFNAPVVAFVFGADGLLIGASLEGAKYSQITR